MASTDLDPARIEQAIDVIDPLFQRSRQYEDAQLSHRLGRRVVVKDETRNPLRSFKGRGADFMVSRLPGAQRTVCASSGNFGQALAYASRRAAIPCTVFLPPDANPVAKERIELLGAEVTVAQPGQGALKQQAKAYALARPGRVLIEDGKSPAIAEGAGTIGIELLAAGPLDTVVVQVGDGALIGGIAAWVKHRSPTTQVIGVCPAASPSMIESWRTGTATPLPAGSIAEGLSIDDPVPESVRRLRLLVDDLLPVAESSLVAAMRLAAETTGTLLEPSGAAGLAALLEHDLPGERIATVFTGSVLRPEHFGLFSPPCRLLPGSFVVLSIARNQNRPERTPR